MRRLLRVRLLPVTLIVLVMVLGFRVNNLFEEDWNNVLQVSQAIAAAEAETPTEATSTEEKPEDAGAGMAKESTDEEVKTPGSLAGRDPSTFSPSEIALLENLAQRREEIEQRSNALDVREGLLTATENRIDEKIDTLKSLESRIEELVKKHSEEEEKRISRLVLVYEKMKAKDAARIFDQIEMDVLLDVTARMKEAKVAEVLAKMSPQRAQELTIELATRNDLESRINR